MSTVFVSIAPATLYAKNSTGTIPQVFVLVADPVGQGYVDSLARPVRNATGLSILTIGLTQKRFQLLRQSS
jgi:putative ABC transport system substrate-binding protein